MFNKQFSTAINLKLQFKIKVKIIFIYITVVQIFQNSFSWMMKKYVRGVDRFVS